MRRQGLVWLAATVLALGAAACFSDPTKALRNGATRLQLSQYTVTLKAGDSLGVRAYALDDQGNQLDVGTPTWTSADPTIATVRADAPAPGDVFANGVVLGINNQAGVTTVTVTLDGVSADIRVTVLPATFPSAPSVTGTAGADTFIVNRPAPALPLVVTYSAGDTLVLNATSTVTFSATSSTVSFGAFTGYMVARSATQLKVMARQPFMGKPVVTNLTYAGNTTTGPIAIASLLVDSINIQHARFRGAVSVGASGLGANTVITVAAPAGATFTTGSSGSAVTVGTAGATILSRTATQIQGITSANATGTVLVTKVIVGAATTDSLRTMAASTIAASYFPGTIANGNGRLLDTVVVLANGTGTFTASGTSASAVTINGNGTFVLKRTSDTMLVIAKFGGTAKVSVTNFVISGPLTVPSLTTSGTTPVDSVNTDEPNEPGNQASATATAVSGITNIGDSTFVYGAMDGQSDQRDYYKFTMPAAGGTVTVTLTWFGNGSGSSDANPDFDVVVCTTLSGTGSCSYSQDIIPNNAASAVNMPETGTTSAIAGSATVFVRTFSYYATANAGEHAYQLKIKTQ